ncbi:MAG: hypothetical protein IJ538_03980 [Clostridia bacterium]|nr:hypothetical protein [Clostridia bacterium]
MELKYKDEEFVNNLLNLKEYKCGGWNPNTLYDMIKLFYLTDEFDISPEMTKKLKSDIAILNKFLLAFSDVNKAVDAICISISNGEFNEFGKLCKQMGLQDDEIKSLINKLSTIYDQEVKDVAENNDRPEVKRYADYEYAEYNVCGPTHKFRQTLNILDDYFYESIESLEQYIDDKERKDYGDYSYDETAELLSRGELDLVITICECHHNEGMWGGLSNEANIRKYSIGYEK